MQIKVTRTDISRVYASVQNIWFPCKFSVTEGIMYLSSTWNRKHRRILANDGTVF